MSKQLKFCDRNSSKTPLNSSDFWRIKQCRVLRFNNFQASSLLHFHTIYSAVTQRKSFSVKLKTLTIFHSLTYLERKMEILLCVGWKKHNNRKALSTFMHFNDVHTIFMSVLSIWKWLGVGGRMIYLLENRELFPPSCCWKMFSQ